MLAKKHRLNLAEGANRAIFNAKRIEGHTLRLFFKERFSKTVGLDKTAGIRVAVVISKKNVLKAAWRNQIKRLLFNCVSTFGAYQRDLDLAIQLKEKIKSKPTEELLTQIKQELEQLLIQIKK